MPENTMNTETEILPPQDMFDPDALLAEQMRRCHHAALECFSVLDREGFDAHTQMTAVRLGAKLVNSSMALAAALDRRTHGETRHRMIYEHVTPPTPHPKKRKTNSGVQKLDHRDG